VVASLCKGKVITAVTPLTVQLGGQIQELLGANANANAMPLAPRGRAGVTHRQALGLAPRARRTGHGPGGLRSFTPAALPGRALRLPLLQGLLTQSRETVFLATEKHEVT
jgi:hypothetical protein